MFKFCISSFGLLAKISAHESVKQPITKESYLPVGHQKSAVFAKNRGMMKYRDLEFLYSLGKKYAIVVS